MSKILFANAPKVTSFWSRCNGALSFSSKFEVYRLAPTIQSVFSDAVLYVISVKVFVCLPSKLKSGTVKFLSKKETLFLNSNELIESN